MVGRLLMGKLGTIEPVVYYVNHSSPSHPPGHVLLAPYSSHPAPDGFTVEYADNLRAVDRLERTLQSQAAREMESDALADQSLRDAIGQRVRDSLTQKMVSSSTTPYERDFIAAWLALREEKRREKYISKYEEYATYLHARHYDTPKGRAVDEERVNLDRLNG
jgi:hypothetical protein